MSVLIGVAKIDPNPLDVSMLEAIADRAQQYGADGSATYRSNSVGMIYRFFDAGYKALPNGQPHLQDPGSVMMMDGRLDNREDLMASIRGLGIPGVERGTERQASDVEIMHVAYSKYGVDGLTKIVGDWCMCVWDECERRLILASDFSGVRRLYYCLLPHAVVWSTDLRALVSGSGRTFELNDNYIAEFLEGMPASHLTPYKDIKVVPAGHWVEIRKDTVNVHQYWTWDTSTPIRYKLDKEYEEHCHHLLRQSVKRRLRSEFPVVAELSGGVDSSSIVCLADDIIENEGACTSALHTLSSYHPDEPTCDERPYFSIIERARGREGFHIDASKYDKLMLDPPFFVPVPFYPHGVFEEEKDYWTAMNSVSARTLLSGIGGDEFLGGVRTGIAELADALYLGDHRAFLGLVRRWSLVSRIPRWRLVVLSLRVAVAGADANSSNFRPLKGSLLSDAFIKRAQRSYSPQHAMWIGGHSLPGQRMFVETWRNLLDQMGLFQPPMDGKYERAFPYLDRDLLTFLINIPREQVIRAGERRSLMRRSLSSVVPHEVLFRKGKATAVRRYARAIIDQRETIETHVMHEDSPWMMPGYLDRNRVVEGLDRACNGFAAFNRPIMGVLGLDAWSRSGTGFIAISPVGRVDGVSGAACPKRQFSGLKAGTVKSI